MNSPCSGLRKKSHDSHRWVLIHELGNRTVCLLRTPELGKEAIPKEAIQVHLWKTLAMIYQNMRRWWGNNEKPMELQRKEVNIFWVSTMCWAHRKQHLISLSQKNAKKAIFSEQHLSCPPLTSLMRKLRWRVSTTCPSYIQLVGNQDWFEIRVWNLMCAFLPSLVINIKERYKGISSLVSCLEGLCCDSKA